MKGQSFGNKAEIMGPLSGIKVIELGGIGPNPFCSMLLSDMGADVLRIDRLHPSDSGVSMPDRFNLLHRGRKSIGLDLKKKKAVAVVKRLVESADALTEGFRPGVAERLGLGPEDCFAINPELVYGRITGWGQEGPLAPTPGHDLNYIALTGLLHSVGPAGGPPLPPTNLMGDFGGGALYLALGVLAAIIERQKSGRGQVVDAAIVDGSASLMTGIYGMWAAGVWKDTRGSNRTDSGTPWYNVYETKDGRYVAMASNEPRFYRATLRLMGLDGEDLPDQHDNEGWPRLKARFAEVFRQRTRDEWCELMNSSDACFAPILSLQEAPQHPHNVARGTFVTVDGIVQPGAAPRFSRTPSQVRGSTPTIGEHTSEALLENGFTADEIADLRKAGAIA
jgi:alpha-methylacyl-CoA racemase